MFDIWPEHLGSKQPYSCITSGKVDVISSLNPDTFVENIPETLI